MHTYMYRYVHMYVLHMYWTKDGWTCDLEEIMQIFNSCITNPPNIWDHKNLQGLHQIQMMMNQTRYFPLQSCYQVDGWPKFLFWLKENNMQTMLSWLSQVLHSKTSHRYNWNKEKYKYPLAAETHDINLHVLNAW